MFDLPLSIRMQLQFSVIRTRYAEHRYFPSLMIDTVRLLAFSEQHAPLRLRLAFILFALIIVIGNWPGARAEAANVASGFVLHSSAYAFITYLLFSGRSISQARRAIFAILAVTVMGAMDEFIQSFFPYRGASAGDWLVDVCASLVASALLYFWYPRAQKRMLSSR